MSNIKWPLINNTIEDNQKSIMADFIMNSDRFTQGEKVKEFEKKWSKWQGAKHSVFVNSGSSANLILLDAIKELYFPERTPNILVPACTWSTTLSPLITLGYNPVFCDVSLSDYGFDVTGRSSQPGHRVVSEDIDIIFFTHLLGLPSNVSLMKSLFPNAMVLEDCCEAHGALVNGNKVGNHGQGSTFSFYYGHHMTTIEGGMVSTNNDILYDKLLAKRSHGLARETEQLKSVSKNYSDIDPRFLFLTTGYNVRSTELNAVLGIHQLDDLDESISKRRSNFITFRTILQDIGDMFLFPKTIGNSSFALPFMCKDVDKNKLESYLQSQGIETRPFLAGNMLRQPFLHYLDNDPKDYPNAEFLHNNCFYIGNNQHIGLKELNWLNGVLREFFNMHNS